MSEQEIRTREMVGEVHPTLVAIFTTYPFLAACMKEAVEHPGALRYLNHRACLELVCALALQGCWLRPGAGTSLHLIPDSEVEEIWLRVKAAGHRYRVGSGQDSLWSFAEEVYHHLFRRTVPRRGWHIPRDPSELFVLMKAFARAFANLQAPKRRVMHRPK